MSLKETIKKLVPSSVIKWRNRLVFLRGQKKFGERTVADTFSEIYQENLWGGESGEFYSGTGSDEPYALPYAALVKKVISDHGIKTVVDLGCGDFRVAAKFVSADINYTGCDVVPALIQSLNKNHAAENIEFRVVNIIEDELPSGDLCLIRQVLQHLSNAEISLIMEKCRKFKYLLVTEHFPAPGIELVPNLDLNHGPATRLYRNSAVCLDQPPFSISGTELLLQTEAEENTRIKSFLITSSS